MYYYVASVRCILTQYTDVRKAESSINKDFSPRLFTHPPTSPKMDDSSNDASRVLVAFQRVFWRDDTDSGVDGSHSHHEDSEPAATPPKGA